MISVFLHVVHGKYRTATYSEWSNGTVHFDRTGPTEKSGPPRRVNQFFRNFPVGKNRSIQFNFRPKFPEILAEWIAPFVKSTARRGQRAVKCAFNPDFGRVKPLLCPWARGARVSID